MSIRRQTLWSLVPTVLTTVVSLVSVRIMYNGLGAEMYALLLYVYMMTGTFGFMDLGIGNALARYMGISLSNGDAQAVREYWRVGMQVGVLFTALFSLIFILAGTCIGPLWFNVSPENQAMLQWCFAAGGISLFLSYTTSLWERVCQVHLDFPFISKMKVVFFLLQILPSMFLAWRFGIPVYLLIWGVAVQGLNFIVFAVYVRKKYNLRTLSQEAYLRSRFGDMKVYMMKSFATLLVNNVFTGLDRVVLGRLAPPEAFGHYGIAFNAGNRAQALSVSFMGPVFCNMNLLLKDTHQVKPADVYDYTCTMMLNWLLLGITATLFFSKPILTVWLGTELAANVLPVFVPVVLACGINAFSNLSNAALGAIDRLGFGIKIITVAGVSAALLCGAGFWFHGITGAAYGYLISRISYVYMDWVTAKRFLHAKGVYTFPVLIRILVYMLVGSCSYWLMGQMSGDVQAVFAFLTLALAGIGLAVSEMKRPSLDLGQMGQS